MDPAGKVAVVSGGASGLGAATAAAMAEAGATVVVLDRAEPSSVKGVSGRLAMSPMPRALPAPLRP